MLSESKMQYYWTPGNNPSKEGCRRDCPVSTFTCQKEVWSNSVIPKNPNQDIKANLNAFQATVMSLINSGKVRHKLQYCLF